MSRRRRAASGPRRHGAPRHRARGAPRVALVSTRSGASNTHSSSASRPTWRRAPAPPNRRLKSAASAPASAGSSARMPSGGSRHCSCRPANAPASRRTPTLRVAAVELARSAAVATAGIGCRGSDDAKCIGAPIGHVHGRVRARQQPLEQGSAFAGGRRRGAKAKVQGGTNAPDAMMRILSACDSLRILLRASTSFAPTRRANCKSTTRCYRGAVIVSASAIVACPPIAGVEELTPAHAADVRALEPEVVLLGTGARQIFPAT